MTSSEASLAAKEYANDTSNKGAAPRDVLNPGAWLGFIAGAQWQSSRDKAELENMRMDFEGRKMSEEAAVSRANELIVDNKYQKEIIGASFKREHDLTARITRLEEALNKIIKFNKYQLHNDEVVTNMQKIARQALKGAQDE